MKKKAENSTVNYDPEKVTEKVSINFTKVSNANGTTVYGKIIKEEAEVGNVSYDARGGFLITSLKPVANLAEDEIKAIYSAVPDCIADILSEE